MNQFTEREKEVVDLLLQGRSNKQIALVLGISRSTVEFHLKNIYLKLGVRSRTEAVLQLSKNSQGKPTGRRKDGSLWQSTVEKSIPAGYSSQAKRFFDPKEEKAMKNRTTISIILSVIAILAVCGVLAYLRSEKTGRLALIQSPAPNSEAAVPTHTPRVLYVPPEAATRYYDEILLILQSPEPPFHFAAVFVGVDCIIPGGEACAFTDPIPFPDGEPLSGSSLYWMPDEENGFYVRDNQILILNRLERKSAVSDVLVPDILKTDNRIRVSPDGRWLVESVQMEDPYASDLVLIKTTTGRVNQLDIGLEECFKTPLGWLSPTKFLFRCDVSTGVTSKKFLSGTHYYTYDVLSSELLEFEPGVEVGFGDPSPNGRYIVFIEQHGDLRDDLHVKDLSNGKVYPLNIHDGQIVWSHDSGRMAIFTDNGDIFISNYDGSEQRKIHSSGEQGYLSMEWFPDDKYIALVGYFNGSLDKTQMIVLSINGDVIHYDPIPTTEGYNIIDISPLPAINK